jgi:pimeloyl-ACP methyl ester carboxylesterase
MNLLPIIRGIGFLFPVLSQTLFAHIHVQDIMEPTEPRFVRDLFLKDAGSAHFPSVMARISIVSTLDMVEKTKKITAPVLVVYGSEDHFTKQSSIELHSILSNSQLVSLPGGHLPHLTSPKKFAEMSMVFIGSKLIDEL